MKKNPNKSYYAEWNNRKHKNPSPEEVEVDSVYAFTYNPKTQPMTPSHKLNLIVWHNYIDKIFQSCKNCHIVLRPELSQGSRWHYHGHIIIKDIMKFFIYDLPVLRIEGTFEIDTIKDKIVWQTYISKQEKLMLPICKEHKIPYIYDNTKVMKVKVEPLQDIKSNELIRYEDSESESDEATSTPEGGETPR